MQQVKNTDAVRVQLWKVLHNSLIRVSAEGTVESINEAELAGAEPGQIEAALQKYNTHVI